MKTKLFFTLFALCMAMTVLAQTPKELLKKGCEYYEAENYSQAFIFFEKAANQGDADAQYYLGLMYDYGEGVSQDYQKAAYWYEKAANQGEANAQYNIGHLYYLGEGVPEDKQKAVYWWEKAANQGEADVQYILGLMYDLGEGVSQDYQKAAYWFEKAANQGVANAQYYLGHLYHLGDGLSQDYQKAAYWYEKAANQGVADAQLNLGLLYEYGEGVSQDYQKAAYWFEKAANENSMAKLCLENLKKMGVLVPTSSSGKKITMIRSFLVNKINDYCYQGTSFRFDNGIQLEIRYLNAGYWQKSYSKKRKGIYIAVGKCEDTNYDWNVNDCEYFDEWYVGPLTVDQWQNEKIEFDSSGTVHYYLNGNDMGTHQFNLLKKLAQSRTLTLDFCPYGWYTGHHHYTDNLILSLPSGTIRDNFSDGVIDLDIWQKPDNPQGVREENGILKTEQVRTDWPFHLRTQPLSLE